MNGSTEIVVSGRKSVGSRHMLLNSTGYASAARSDTDKINGHFAVIGLGYVGLPADNAFAKRRAHVVGFDKTQSRIDALKAPTRLFGMLGVAGVLVDCKPSIDPSSLP